MWTQFRLLLLEQSDLGLHCLLEASKIFQQTTFVVIGALWVNR